MSDGPSLSGRSDCSGRPGTGVLNLDAALLKTGVHLGGAALGVAAGLGFALAWRWAFPPGAQSKFWIALSAYAFLGSTVDAWSDFAALYRRLAATLARYLARSLAVAAAAVAAIVAATVLGLYPLQARWDAAHGVWAVIPAAVAQTGRREGEAMFYVVGERPLRLSERDRSRRFALCWTGPGCLGLSLLGFEVATLTAPPRGVDGPVLARIDHGDLNPFFPYLGDPEALFLLALAVSAAAGLVWPPRPGSQAPASIIRSGDFALVHLNEQLKPLVHLAGRIETRVVRARLPEGPLDRPIVITGLARAGTTTVLNALTRSRELGSHRYRDFPFLAAPLAWNAVRGRIGRDAAPAERPHKDRILVTPDSPEAFSEVLWQHDFPHVHDPNRNQRLGEGTRHPRFESFLVDHIRKILLLRGAPRYVEKANYHVGRIEYLARLFPDARFLVPVRAPLDHVGSLVRQHELFSGYAQADPRVPLYLAAAGHYEFGPQRRPIAYTDAGAVETLAAFAAGDDAMGYALQWAEVYGHVARLKASRIGGRIVLISYERLCAHPAAVLAELVRACELDDPEGAIAAYAARISVSRAEAPASVLERRDEIARVTGPAAQALGVDLG